MTTAGNGALFSINTGGSDCTDLHVFGGSITSVVGSVTNVFPDGTTPTGSLLLFRLDALRDDNLRRE